MQHLENDMDGLFQRSAEHYELDAGDSGWDTVAGKLQQHESNAATFKKSCSLTMFGFVLVHALLSLIGICFPKQINDVVLNQARTGHQKSDYGLAANHNSTDMILSNGNGKLISVTNAQTEFVVPQNPAVLASRNLISVFDATKYKNAMQQRFITVAGSTSTLENINDDYSQQLIIERRKNLIASFARVNILPGTVETIEIPASENNVDKNNSLGKLKSKGFYVGLFVAMDLSKVRSMPFRKIGSGAGILLGYNISNRFSAEASLCYQRKKYDSYGKDFSLDKVGATMPAGMVINSLYSNINVTEVNIKARYKLVEQKRSSVNISAGLSEYIITKERNIYVVSINGNTATMLGKYEKNIAKLPAVMAFSVAYDYNISKKTSIRIEPYLKIPLQGIGVGSVPVTSAGIQFGITRSLY